MRHSDKNHNEFKKYIFTFANKMKIRIFLTIFSLFALLLQANACDVCGCSMGGSYIGILPQFHKNFVGFQYSYRSFNSEHSILGTSTKSISQEKFQTIEMRGRFHLTSKIQLFVFVPYSINQQLEKNISSKINGLGDVSAIVNYNIFNSGDSTTNKLKHTLLLGGGLKIPTGKFRILDQNNSLNPNLQTGSGSYDFILNAIYTVRLKKIGVNNIVLYHLNNTNTNEYQFGNKFSLNTSLFYWFNLKGYSILPYLGINYENAKSDKHSSDILAQSGGNTINSSFGLDFYYKKITLGFNAQLPFYQDNLITNANTKLNTTVIFNF